ncbi:hypothetical protein [Treponema pedis]|uniref:DUF1871 family protein n=1 Tax=Treponema pedis TaxID=409322 RepID=A0A7S6WQU2_9SPIR|nr:hypothetical protein [Treponema pedis]QOW61631.1 hypothetical protein IFE08_04420 [Treponema pedis]
MKVNHKLKEEINDILSEWNPLDVPAFIASVEYTAYIESIIKAGESIDLLRKYFINLIIEQLGLSYDPSNIEQKNSLEDVIEKVMTVLLENEKLYK